MMISLMKLFGSWVTIMHTACATSAGRSMRSRALFSLLSGEKLVSVDPGRTGLVEEDVGDRQLEVCFAKAND